MYFIGKAASSGYGELYSKLSLLGSTTLVIDRFNVNLKISDKWPSVQKVQSDAIKFVLVHIRGANCEPPSVL